MKSTMPLANLSKSAKPFYCTYGVYLATDLCRLKDTL